MNTPFIFKLVSSFFIGGLWIVGATVVADKSSPKVGGLISGLPSTVVLGLFFVAWTQTPEAAVQAATVIPLMGGINSLFLVVYVFFVRKNIGLAVLSSLTLWLALSYVLVKTRFDNYTLSLLGYGFLFLGSFLLMEKVFKIPSIKGRMIRYTPWQIFARALTGGTVVSLAVYLGKVGGPLWGGIFSVFPAMFLSTMVVTSFAQGALFSAGVMKSSMLGAISVVVYAVVVRLTYIPLGLWIGTFAALIASYGSGWVLYKFVIAKLR